MKKTLAILLLLFSLVQLHAREYKVYFWMKYKKYTSQSHSLDISFNGKSAGYISAGDLGVVHVLNDKAYKIELYDKGKVLGTLTFEHLKDSISYYIIDLETHTVESVDALKGGIYVMQRNHYYFLRSLYEDGLEDNNGLVTSGDAASDHSAYGSGFLVSNEGYIATNYHVVDGYTKYKVKGVEGDFTTEYEADVVAKDVNNDLALLQLKNKTVKFSEPPYVLKTTGASTGEDIFVLGYPLGPALGDEIKLTTGVISAKSGIGGNVSSYQISAAAQPGNSGGPLFDSEGNIIGVVNAKIMRAENITYAVKAVYLQALIGMLPINPHQQDKNGIKDKKLTDKVSAVSKYVYIIKCE